MQSIIAQPGRDAHLDPVAVARQCADRLARATTGQMEAALAYLSVIDPGAFDIAFAAVTPDGGEVHEEKEPVPVCCQCGGLVGIFVGRGLQWQHYRGDSVTSGAQEIYAPGHAAEVVWIVPGEDPGQG